MQFLEKLLTTQKIFDTIEVQRLENVCAPQLKEMQTSERQADSQ